MKNENFGYIGNRMSKNAYKAHQDGQFPLSKIDAKLLRKCRFKHSVAFFRWLCKKGYIKPIGYHHTGVAYTMTRFYDSTTITYVADKYNLALLYDMYMGRINRSDAKKMLGVTFVKAKIPASLLNIKSTINITVDAVSYQGYYFISKDKWIFPNKNQIQIIDKWSEEPSTGEWKNQNKSAIIRKIILYKDIKDIIN